MKAGRFQNTSITVSWRRAGCSTTWSSADGTRLLGQRRWRSHHRHLRPARIHCRHRRVDRSLRKPRCGGNPRLRLRPIRANVTPPAASLMYRVRRHASAPWATRRNGRHGNLGLPRQGQRRGSLLRPFQRPDRRYPRHPLLLRYCYTADRRMQEITGL